MPSAMPYQNRVTPYGELVATAARGTLMGNRGCLHDRGDRVLRPYQSRRWIICLLDFKRRARAPMPPGHYTSLFFLDEATALAAGHRPCAECQRARFTTFRALWAVANPEHTSGELPAADTIDAVLHRERISQHGSQRNTVKRTYAAHLDRIPDGALIVLDGNDTPHLALGDALFPWSFDGYGDPVSRPTTGVQVLTPRSTVRALALGYEPSIHPSARR